MAKAASCLQETRKDQKCMADRNLSPCAHHISAELGTGIQVSWIYGTGM